MNDKCSKATIISTISYIYNYGTLIIMIKYKTQNESMANVNEWAYNRWRRSKPRKIVQTFVFSSLPHCMPQQSNQPMSTCFFHPRSVDTQRKLLTISWKW